MTYAPPPAHVDRGARALAKAKSLEWDRMPEHWRGELRRQAIAVLIAANATTAADPPRE